MDSFYQVAVNFPLKQSILTYKSDQILEPGELVTVPLGKRKEKGCIVSKGGSENSEFKIKHISEKIEELKILPPDLDLLKWMANYYHYSLGKLVFDILPKPMKRPRTLKHYEGSGGDLGFDISDDQTKVLTSIKTDLASGFSKHLIHGVTGSGKTAIYIELMKELISKGHSVLFILPEINLTPQFMKVFQETLSCPIYTYHSAVSNSDKYGLWKLLQDDQSPKLIVGVRSAVFLPVQKLGLIIVDEEHDSSLKQDDRCPYHARDIAIKKSSILNIPTVLGSATPSMESLRSFKNTKYYHRLSSRINNIKLPDIELVDLRERSIDSDYKSWPLCNKSIDYIGEALKKKEQVLIFINRLGYSSYIQCSGCGHQFFCMNCSTPLKYYKLKKELICHHCDYKEAYPNECPKCGVIDLSQKGFGTEKVQEVLQNIFKDSKVDRFDRAEIKTFTALEQKLSDFHEGKIDILIGTQMLSKGHNFKKVNLVIVLGVDNELNYPDFRSQEKAFQLLAQVSGRAGRYTSEGKVLIQTLNPEL